MRSGGVAASDISTRQLITVYQRGKRTTDPPLKKPAMIRTGQGKGVLRKTDDTENKRFKEEFARQYRKLT